MNVKTFTASTIQQALSTAREKLGDDVVLLESAAAGRGAPARVTVMADASTRTRSRGRQQQHSQGNRRKRSEETARRSEGFSPAATATQTTRRQQRYQSIQDLIEDTHGGDGANQPASPSGNRREKQARGRLFPTNGKDTDTPGVADPQTRTAHLLEQQLTLVHERLDRMERRLGESLVGTAQQWAAHPLFADLLDKGLRPATVAQLFDNLAEMGYEPDRTDHQTLRWHLAQQLRRSIDIPTPKNSSGTLLFVGPSGAGKSSLLLKLAKNQNFFGRRNTAVISLLPENEDEMFYRNPADICRQCGLSVQTVRTPEEMNQALDRIAHFDQVLIDTPPIPMQPRIAQRALKHIRRLVEPVVPLETHLVMNTTRSLEGFEPEQVEQMPLSVDCVALTHLDETNKWGRTAEWITTLSLPIRFASVGRQMPEGVTSFSSSRFIEEMMDLT